MVRFHRAINFIGVPVLSSLKGRSNSATLIPTATFSRAADSSRELERFREAWPRGAKLPRMDRIRIRARIQGRTMIHSREQSILEERRTHG